MTRVLALTLAALVASAPAFAAKDPCKDVSVKKDSFGSTRVYDKGDIKFRKGAEQMTMVIDFNGGGSWGGMGMANGQQVPPGTAIEVMMVDGTVIPLATSSPAGPVTYYVMGIMVTKYPLSVIITPEQAASLLAGEIKAARVLNGAETWMAMDVKTQDAAKWRTTVQCMISS